MLKKNRKQVIYAFLIVFIIFFISALCIFLYFKSKESSSIKQDVSTTFKKSDTITITSTLPISDELGKQIDGTGTKKGIQGYSEFVIKNNTDKITGYEVFIEKKEQTKQIKGNYIKFYLTDNNGPLKGFEQNSVPTYNDLLSLNDKPAARLLYSGKLKGKETTNLTLRVWLSDSYVVSTEENNFIFSIRVRAK